MQNLHHKKVIAALIMHEDTVLIAQRAQQGALYGKWEFPGGKMEAGETEHECLQRELQEELSIDAQIDDYFCSSFFEHKNSPYEMRLFFVRSFTGTLTLHEHKDMKWVRPQDLKDYDMPDPDKPVVEELIKYISL